MRRPPGKPGSAQRRNNDSAWNRDSRFEYAVRLFKAHDGQHTESKRCKQAVSESACGLTRVRVVPTRCHPHHGDPASAVMDVPLASSEPEATEAPYSWPDSHEAWLAPWRRDGVQAQARTSELDSVPRRTRVA